MQREQQIMTTSRGYLILKINQCVKKKNKLQDPPWGVNSAHTNLLMIFYVKLKITLEKSQEKSVQQRTDTPT